jgi:hypothetical protein
MARFWFPGGARVRNEIAGWLTQRNEGRIVSDAKLRDWGCYFPNRRYGELFYLLDNGSLFAPSFMNLGKVTAMHGFDPAEHESRACWLTTHPVISVPRQIHQIFDVMRDAAKAIDIDNPANNGLAPVGA